MFSVNQDLHIPEHELTFTFSRSSGPGGQNVNKVSSKALLRWNPGFNNSLPLEVKERFLRRFAGRITKEGEVLITSDEFRDRRKNQENCLKKLKAMILEVSRPPKKRLKTKPTRSSQIRRREEKRLTSRKKLNRARPRDE